jgi:hypothetical protein
MNDESLDLRLTAPAAGNPGRAFGWVDLAVLGLLAAFIYARVTVAREWSGVLQPVPKTHLEARYLPLYAIARLTVRVIRTNEELMIARSVALVLRFSTSQKEQR